jgi:hypothetical protein
MNIWRVDMWTGKFPPLRVAWNALWWVPIMVSRCLFVALIFCQSGPENAIRAWEATS